MVARQHHAVWLLLIASASVNTWGTHAFVGPFPSFSSRSRQLASSYYDGMDYTARRNKEQEKPDWAGGGPISSVVSALINNKFLYNFMKIGARKVLIDNAEKKGVAWREDAEALLKDRRLPNTLSRHFGVSHATMDYPAYYTQPFHAYEDGNLNWLAAAEVESATSAMCLRVWPKDAGIKPEEAQDRLRDSYQKEIRRHMQEHGTDPSRQDLNTWGARRECPRATSVGVFPPNPSRAWTSPLSSWPSPSSGRRKPPWA
ncbi:methyltransferase type 11 [Nannochloropsis gaditana]|uniref:Methyltransferase type 11 n=1 Tax=Nannochloropsis gaditana TaxID=72520 RepID=W7U4C7_9STRA|nr:methyltransferase type 11 [Nannochloropsis gaditana]